MIKNKSYLTKEDTIINADTIAIVTEYCVVLITCTLGGRGTVWLISAYKVLIKNTFITTFHLYEIFNTGFLNVEMFKNETCPNLR